MEKQPAEVEMKPIKKKEKKPRLVPVSGSSEHGEKNPWSYGGKKLSRKAKKNTKTRKSNRNKTRRKKMKGGFLSSMGITLPGIGSFGKESGRQVYQNGEWREQPCYNIMGFKFCK